MPKRMPYDDLATLYNKMKEYANEDGYCICSPAAILAEMGKPLASMQRMLDLLVKMGCLTEHVSKQRRPKAGPVRIYSLTRQHITPAAYEHAFE